jgi:hypothetical protein
VVLIDRHHRHEPSAGIGQSDGHCPAVSPKNASARHAGSWRKVPETAKLTGLGTGTVHKLRRQMAAAN